MDKYIVGLDIGTTKIACFVGERAPEGKVRILGFGKTESLGVERGIVRNIRSTSASIRRAVDEAMEMAKLDINEVYVGIAGQHIKSRPQQGSIMIPDGHRQIEQSDIDKLINDQYQFMLPPGEVIIHVFPQNYIVDGDQLDINIDPVGVAGKHLVANFHVVTGNQAHLENIRDAVKDAGLTIKGVVLEPIASAYAVLDQDDKDAGVALVDIGGGTTDIAIFQEGIIRHTSVLPLAGNSISKDIREKCNIRPHQAENLKTKFGSCLPSNVNQDDIISIPGPRCQVPREISVKQLAGIIKERVQVILEQVGYEIELSGFQRQLIAGIALTGGGAKLKHIKEFCELTTGIESRIGTPDEHLDKNGSVTFEDLSHPMYATGIGLVLYGLQEAERHQEEELKSASAKVESEPEPIIDSEPVAEDSTEQSKDEQKKKKNTKKGAKNGDWMGKVNGFLNQLFDSESNIE